MSGCLIPEQISRRGCFEERRLGCETSINSDVKLPCELRSSVPFSSVELEQKLQYEMSHQYYHCLLIRYCRDILSSSFPTGLIPSDLGYPL